MNKFKVGDLVDWIEPETGNRHAGWRVVDAPDDDGVYDPLDMYVIRNEKTGSEAQVCDWELVGVTG